MIYLPLILLPLIGWACAHLSHYQAAHLCVLYAFAYLWWARACMRRARSGL